MHDCFTRRCREIRPFLAMEVLERAQALEKSGRTITYMCVGEPDVPPHPAVQEACVQAIREGRTGYTHSLGVIELREAIARYYDERYGVAVSPDRIVVSSGTSPLMLLIFSMIVERGRDVVLTDPCYACYPNYVRFLEGRLRTHPLSPTGADYAGMAALVDGSTAAVMVNSPANPTGEVMSADSLREIAGLQTEVISDEIYHGLCYEGSEETMLRFRDDAFVINGFSKAFSMTGWRIGYAIVPERWTRTVRSLHQNFLICAPSFVQWAAIAALERYGEIFTLIRDTFSRRRDILLRGLRNAGLNYWGNPTGAFYILVDFRFKNKDSLTMSFELLDRYGLAVTPGIDFGPATEGWIRLSYATSIENINNALELLKRYAAETPALQS